MESRNAAYVRGQMLAPQAPPTRESGVIKWVRENLFSSWLNGILTIISLLLALSVLVELISWAFLNSHWFPNSLSECRAADMLLPPRWGFQFYDLFQLPIVLIRELIGGLLGLDPVRMLMSPKTAVEETWMAMQQAPDAVTGACWAMVRERWHQFIFGFYPPALWWRPILAFGLLFVAIGPVLYSGQKRTLGSMIIGALVFLLVTMWLASAPVTAFAVVIIGLGGLLALSQTRPAGLLWFTALYPALCFLLLWGGSVWVPVSAMLGFVVLALVARLLMDRVGAPVAVGLGVVAAAIWWLYLGGQVASVLAAILPLQLEAVRSDQFGGFLLSIVIGVTAISCSLPVGIILALGRQSNMLIVKTLSVAFIEFIRGVPLITLLFTASLLLQYFLPPNTQFDIILRVIILVTFFAAAYLAEVIRGGLAALPRGQYEAADALGLDYWQAQRLIIMPQALKVSIPGIVSTFIGLFKDTTLVAFVGLMDPLKGVTQIVRADINWKGIYWEPYIYVGAIFFVICFGMSRYSMYLERKLKTDHR